MLFFVYILMLLVLNKIICFIIYLCIYIINYIFEKRVIVYDNLYLEFRGFWLDNKLL